jgi:secreted Zn-dependent insulinase-like peptidase
VSTPRILALIGLTGWALFWTAAASSAGEVSWWRPAPAADGGAVGIYRSPADDRHYRYLRLDNGLQLVLISDPDGDKSAAALSVATGSFDNPRDRPGLAHFLEHMLFLGTEKYPEPGAYQAFISAHGGSHNAYTSLERTTYFFDIEPAHLEPALDRFAQFFIAPRFDAEYVERERNAVDAEYQLKLRDDGRRRGDVIAEVINPDHPLAKFSVGNSETLADRDGQPVREDLRDFYRRHYSADRMTLAVSGPSSLDDLERMVTGRFGVIARRPTVARPEPVPLLPDSGPLLAQITPDRDRRELVLLFELPPQADQWRVKPATFLGHLLGGESQHSLLAELKAHGWAERLNAGLAYDTDRGAAFALTLGLTPEGVTAREAVLDLTWHWIHLARERGLDAWRYDEVAAMQRADFRFLRKAQPMDQVLQVAEFLHDYPPAEVLRGPYLFQGFDAVSIAAVAEQLRPDNALITLTAPEFEDLPRRSGYYRTPYEVERPPASRVAAWSTARAPADSPLRLPGPNPYIPEEFPVSARGGPATAPQLLADGDGMQFWHYRDRRFGTPRTVLSARVLAPSSLGPRGAALTELYLALIRDQLNTELYPAFLAGLDFALRRWDGGVDIELSGYSEKQQLLLDRVLAALAAPDWDTASFARVKGGLIREWRNTGREWPVRLAMMELSPLLRDTPRPLDLAAILEPVDGEALRQFSATLYRGAAVKVYAGGVMAGEQAGRMAAEVASRLGVVAPAGEFAHEVRRLEPGAVVPRRGVATPQAGRAALLYLQGAADSLAERARVAVLQKFIEAPFYTTLRTERQLGYVVGSQIMPFHRVPGMILYVQSPRVGAERLALEVDEFVGSRCLVLAATEEADLERIKQAVLAGLEEQPRNLEEQADRHRESLALDYLEFDFRPRLAAAVQEIDAEDLKSACGRLFGDRRRGLWIFAADADSVAELERQAPALGDGEYRYPW